MYELLQNYSLTSQHLAFPKVRWKSALENLASWWGWHLSVPVVISWQPRALFWTSLCFATGQGVDEPLSETGFRQATAAGSFLKNVLFTHAFSSDLTRTRQVSSVPRSRLWGGSLSSVWPERSTLGTTEEESAQAPLRPLPTPHP